MQEKVFKTVTSNSHVLSTYLCFELIIKVWIVEFHKSEEQRSFLGDGVLPRNLFLHVFLQKGHVAKKTSRKSPQQLEQQLNLSVVASNLGGKRRIAQLPDMFVCQCTNLRRIMFIKKNG